MNDPIPMSEEVHREAHLRLHKSLDRLVADFLTHNPKARLTHTSIMTLMLWSSAQVKNPTPEKR